MGRVNDGLIDELEVRKAIAQLKPNGKLFEVRVLQDKKVLSGYFRDADALLRAMGTVDLRGANVYFTLNAIDDALFSRQQCEKFLASKLTTNDKDIIGYEWLFIDMDPCRPSGISSNEHELQMAKELATKIHGYMRDMGFEEPVRALSGNGAHLLYRVTLANNEANRKLIENCLKALSLMFDTDEIKVDTANFNPARICKLYGSMAQKGADTSERPHRMSMILGDVHDVIPTQKIYLEKLASQAPETEQIQPARYNRYVPSEFDIETWMSEHGIGYTVKQWHECTKYVLNECPFDSNHKAPDSSIIKQSNGAIGFKCLHDSCQGRTWQDVRKMFEPDAYEQKDSEIDRAIEEGWKRHNRERTKEETNVQNGDRWETVKEILAKPTPDNEYIRTHIKEIDTSMHGLVKGGLSAWSGLRASAKSTILSQIALQAINDGHGVLMYSGELTDKRLTRWLIQQAAGRQYMTRREDKTSGSTFWVVPSNVQNSIADWIGDKLHVYNNGYGSEFSELFLNLEHQIQTAKPDLVILDNLMTLEIDALSSNQYDAQTKVMKMLKDMATKYNVHIAMVAHPRKAISFLRLMDISGTGNISNLVDSAFIVHRVNHDFKKGYIDEFMEPKTKKEDVPLLRATNVIEIAKDREEGIQDKFIPLWYETESRRMRNDNTEVIKFGWTSDWQDDNGFMDIGEEDPF